MKRFFRQIAAHVRRELPVLRTPDRPSQFSDLPPGAQERLLDEGRAPRV